VDHLQTGIAEMPILTGTAVVLTHAMLTARKIIEEVITWIDLLNLMLIAGTKGMFLCPHHPQKTHFL